MPKCIPSNVEYSIYWIDESQIECVQAKNSSEARPSQNRRKVPGTIPEFVAII